MPTPQPDETHDEFINRCIPIVLDDGTADDNKQAYAVCQSMWEQDKEDNKMTDNKHEMDTIIAWGGAVKALGNGRIGGYLVRFTTDEDPDLEGEFFTKDTDFGDAETAPVFYQHGMDPKLGKRRLGKAKHKRDEFGIWAETQLEMRDEYEQFIYEMAEAGKMGWSSGVPGHLIERESYGKAVWIKMWLLGLDDTLTPIPAEPRNTALPLKSWEPEEWKTDGKGFSRLPSLTIVDRTHNLTQELKQLNSDLRGLIESIDGPLNEVKRKELQELHEMFSEMDDVRADIPNVPDTASQPTLVSTRLLRHRMSETRKRLAPILQE